MGPKYLAAALLLAAAARSPAAVPEGMVLIPSGNVTMGAPDGDADERPVHRVRVDAFWIDRCEVTNRQYHAFAEATGRATPPPGSDQHPVVSVTWDEAAAYARWAGKRLPSEAEWERAARGDDARPYPWGSAPPGAFPQGNFADEAARRSGFIGPIVEHYDDGWATTAPVGSFPRGASPFGVLDMAGNAFEWCADYYDPAYYASSPVRNPRGPSTGSAMCVRGGSWHNAGFNLRSANRSRLAPATRSDRVGFRCARDANP